MLLFCVPRVVPYPFFTLLANPWLSLVFPSLGRILISIAKLSYFSGIASNPPAISVCFPRLPDGNVQVCLVSRNFHKINSLLFFMFPVSMGNDFQIHFLIDNSTQYLWNQRIRCPCCNVWFQFYRKSTWYNPHTFFVFFFFFFQFRINLGAGGMQHKDWLNVASLVQEFSSQDAKRAGLTLSPCVKISSPRLTVGLSVHTATRILIKRKEAPVAFECKFTNIVEVGEG